VDSEDVSRDEDDHYIEVQQDLLDAMPLLQPEEAPAKEASPSKAPRK